MANHRIPMHPMDELDPNLKLHAMVSLGDLTLDEQRYVAEHDAVKLTEGSSLKACVDVLASLAGVHIPQLNVRLKDRNASRHYDNPAELIREESKRRENKKIDYTGNIAETHEYLDKLKERIVTDESPDEMKKSAFWSVLFGFGFLALGVYSWITGGAVDFLAGLLDSAWFLGLFTVATLLLSLIFGFFSIGVLLVGALLVLAWIVFEMPGIAAFAVNAVIFLVAAFCLIVASVDFDNMKKFKNMSAEEHRENRELVDEKKAVCEELTEYSEVILKSLRIIKDKFMSQEYAFYKELQNYLGSNFSVGAIYEVFDFLERYYKKMTR